jgi:hypothetical protein
LYVTGSLIECQLAMDPTIFREARAWLAEKTTERARTERRRYKTILIIAIISAVAAIIAALPVLKSWVW